MPSEEEEKTVEIASRADSSQGWRRLGVIVGSGKLPHCLIEKARSEGYAVVAVAIKGHAWASSVGDVPHLWARLGAGGKIIRWLKRHRIEDLVFAGGIRRPSWVELRPDVTTARILWHHYLLGDDGVLTAVAKALSGLGFRILASQELLPELLVPAGVLGKHAPDGSNLEDIRRGVAAARALGALDIGQSVVVQQGLVIGLEAVEGTSGLIQRCQELLKPGRGGVLVKMRKPKQDLRFDLPTVGPDTITQAAQAGLSGIAIEAGSSLILEPELVASLADSLGLFVVGITAD